MSNILMVFYCYEKKIPNKGFVNEQFTVALYVRIC